MPQIFYQLNFSIMVVMLVYQLGKLEHIVGFFRGAGCQFQQVLQVSLGQPESFAQQFNNQGCFALILVKVRPGQFQQQCCCRKLDGSAIVDTGSRQQVLFKKTFDLVQHGSQPLP